MGRKKGKQIKNKEIMNRADRKIERRESGW
jgi:hypothetical protein